MKLHQKKCWAMFLSNSVHHTSQIEFDILTTRPKKSNRNYDIVKIQNYSTQSATSDKLNKEIVTRNPMKFEDFQITNDL